MSNRCSIYKITNVSNGLNYVGCTTGSVEERFKTHIYRCYNQNCNTKLYNSIRKYGKENFIATLIEECDLESMYDREKYYIKKHNTFNNGLNSTTGGEGCLGYKHSEDVRKKISENVRNGNSHRGKTYDALYGENADLEKLKRKASVKKRWDSLSEEDRSIRMKKTIEKARSNSKVGIETVKEIKGEIKKGLTNKELKEKYPGVEYTLFSQLRHNRRWKDI